MKRLIEFQLGEGVHGIWVLGTTGEFASFSRRERAEAVETAVGTVAGRVPVVANISDAATRLAQRLISPNVFEYLELVPGYSVEEVAVPDHLSGLRLGEAQIRENYQINVIGIKKKVTRMVKGRMVSDEVFNVTPSLDDVIEKGDVLVVIGRQEDLDRLTKLE